MKIEHIAIWVEDIEVMSRFYTKYFDVTRGEKYFNPKKNYTSYFIVFNNGGSRIELMHRPDIVDNKMKRGIAMGYAHIAISLGSKEAVDNLTEGLRSDGFIIEGEPRTTGDGYYESIILDPEGNYIEITE